MAKSVIPIDKKPHIFFGSFSPSSRLFIGFAMLIFSITLAMPHRLPAENATPTEPSPAPWHIKADKINYNKEKSLYHADGNVLITKDKDRIASDHITLDSKTMDTVATGNVTISAKGNKVTGSRISMNLDAKTGTIDDGVIFIEANHYYVSGRKIEKTGATTYKGKRVAVTACDGDKPDWKISGRDLDMSIGGYGQVKHAVLWLKEIPVFYTPFFVFPVKLKRQSGFLSPQFNFSKRKGIMFEQPFFWAITDSVDMTLNGQYMEKRGVMTGMEFRYAASPLSKGTFLVDYLKDHETDPRGMSDDWGYEDPNMIEAARPNSERYWFRAKIDQQLPHDVSMKIDLDWISDQDYLREFKEGFTGFTDTDDYFTDNFGRSLDRYDDTIRENKIGIKKNWQAYSLNLGLIWYDNILIRKDYRVIDGEPVDQQDITLQKLPYVMFTGLKQQIKGTPLYFDLATNYTYYYRQEPDDGNQPDQHLANLYLKGHQMEVYPRLYLPLTFKHYFLFEPSLGYRQTFWHMDDMAKNLDHPDDTPHYLSRDFFDLKSELSTEIFRIYPINHLSVSKIRHTIKPQLTWEYIPDNDFYKYPYFENDIEKTNIITLSLVNLFTSRAAFQETDAINKKGGVHTSSYRQFMRFMIAQTFNLNTNTPSTWIDKSNDFSPLFAEVTFSPRATLSLSGDMRWSHKKKRIVSKNIKTTVSTRRGDIVSLEYRQKSDDVTPENTGESIALSLNLVLTEKLSVYSDYERNILEGQYIKRRLGFLFRKQCWEIELNYIDEDDDQKFGILVNLKGLGELETNFSGP